MPFLEKLTARPTGLMAADLLRRSGVHVRIVDQRAEASRESRAFAIQARSMELFQQLGLAGELLDHGVINSGIGLHVGGARIGSLNYDVAGSPGTPYPSVLLLPQARTEALLIADFARHGVEVKRERSRCARHGREVAIRTLYAIGADGAHSAVRTAVGL